MDAVPRDRLRKSKYLPGERTASWNRLNTAEIETLPLVLHSGSFPIRRECKDYRGIRAAAISNPTVTVHPCRRARIRDTIAICHLVRG